MNTRVAPFDNVKVRPAVNYAINRERARPRRTVVSPRRRRTFIPPTYPQYEKHDLYPRDLAKAKQLIKEAGATGAQVTVSNHDRGIDPKFTAYLTDILDSIGLKAEEKIVNSTVYWTTIGDQATKARSASPTGPGLPAPARLVRHAPEQRADHADDNNNTRTTTTESVKTRRSNDLKKQPTLTSSVNGKWKSAGQDDHGGRSVAPFLNRQFTDFFSTEHRSELLREPACCYKFDYATICHKYRTPLFTRRGRRVRRPDVRRPGRVRAWPRSCDRRIGSGARHGGRARRGGGACERHPRRARGPRLAPAASQLHRLRLPRALLPGPDRVRARPAFYANHVARTGPELGPHPGDREGEQAPQSVISSGGYLEKKSGKPCTTAARLHPGLRDSDRAHLVRVAAVCARRRPENGRDIAVRLLYGGRNSLIVGIARPRSASSSPSCWRSRPALRVGSTS